MPLGLLVPAYHWSTSCPYGKPHHNGQNPGSRHSGRASDHSAVGTLAATRSPATLTRAMALVMVAEFLPAVLLKLLAPRSHQGAASVYCNIFIFMGRSGRVFTSNCPYMETEKNMHLKGVHTNTMENKNNSQTQLLEYFSLFGQKSLGQGHETHSMP